MHVSNMLDTAHQRLLEQAIPSARLDVELLLTYTLGTERSWLHAHDDDELSEKQVKRFESLVQRRLKREPVAYITGKKEFYGREFIVTPDVLIPRPETETLVELGIEVANAVPFTSDRPWGLYVIDVGAGSGAVGLTLMAESRRINDMILADISTKALAVAKRNNRKLFHLKRVQYYESDLLALWHPDKDSTAFADLIVANLPYVDKDWKTSPETTYEPDVALYAEDHGLALIFKLIEQSRYAVRPYGQLLLEADPEQHAAIIEHACMHGFEHGESRGYALSLMRLPQA